MSAIKIEGMGNMFSAIDKKEKQFFDEVYAEIADAANMAANSAIDDVPVNEGRLRNSISASELSNRDWEVVADVFYAPYVEWGTKSKVSVPTELQALANEYKGSAGRGDAADAQEAIKEWCRKKGLESDWYQIFLNIMVHGIKPHPFFWHNIFRERKELKKRIKALLKR